MAPTTEELFSTIADKAIAEAEDETVPLDEFVEGLRVMRDRIAARYRDAREELTNDVRRVL